MSFALLDDQFHSHPKTMRAGNEAAGLFIRLLSYSCAYGTDGYIEDAVALTYGSPELLAKLHAVGFLDDARGGHQVHNFLKRNPSAADVRAKREATRAQRSAAGKRSAEVRLRPQSPNEPGNGPLNEPLPEPFNAAASEAATPRPRPYPKEPHLLSRKRTDAERDVRAHGKGSKMANAAANLVPLYKEGTSK